MPGPQFPLYLLGRELRGIVPIAFLPEHHALAIAIASYTSHRLRLLADYGALYDGEDLEAMLEASLGELVAAAGRGERGAEGSRRCARSRSSGSRT